MKPISAKVISNIPANNFLKTIKQTLYVATNCFILLSNTETFCAFTPSNSSSTPTNGTTNNYYNFTASPVIHTSAEQQSNQKTAQDASLKASQQSIQDTNVNVSHSVNVRHTVAVELPDIGLSDFKKYLTDQYDSSKNQCSSLLQSMGNTIIEHKWKLIALTLAASYAAIVYKIYNIEQLLQKHNSWCNWKTAIPLQHLMLTQTTDLISQLNFDMYCKYGMIIKNMSDTSTIPDLFLHDLQEEINLLQLYTSLLNIASTLHCTRLFYFKYSIDIIEEKRARLTFVYNLFMMIQTQQKK